jgi:hypothetical protein
MTEEIPRGEINMSRIPVTADIPGLLFTIGTVLIFYWGIPELRYVLPAAILVGCGIAVALHFIRHDDSPSRFLTGTK